MENTWNAINNSEINLQLKWFTNCFIVAGTVANQESKLYVPVVALSTQDNAKLPEQLINGFKRTIN